MRLAAILFGFLFVVTPAHACRLALVLAVDISNSIEGREYALQVEGIADALVDPEVEAGLIRARAAVTVLFWSGPRSQYVVVPWRRVRSKADVAALSAEARALRRVYPQSTTGLARGVAFARSLFDEVPDCTARTIDVSGDGQDNARGDVAFESAEAEALGITINGLAIEGLDRDITSYYRDRLITRNGFVMTAEDHRSYGDTLKRKMRREVAEAMM